MELDTTVVTIATVGEIALSLIVCHVSVEHFALTLFALLVALAHDCVSKKSGEGKFAQRVHLMGFDVKVACLI